MNPVEHQDISEDWAKCLNSLSGLEDRIRDYKVVVERTAANLIEFRKETENFASRTPSVEVRRFTPQIIFPHASISHFQDFSQERCTWEWNGKTAQVVHEKGMLILQISSHVGKVESKQRLPNFPGASHEQMLQYFSYCEMVFEQGVACIGPSYFSKESENAKISLLLGRSGELLWSVKDKLTGLSKCSSFRASTLPSNRCSYDSFKAVSAIRVKKFTGGTTYFKEFDVYGVDLQTEHIPFSVFVEPRSFPSRVDSRMLVSKNLWAVTLVAHDGSYGNHAEIIIEGVSNSFNEMELYNTEREVLASTPVGEYFIWRSHFLPTIRSCKISDPVYEQRSQVWMVSRDKIHRMLENIKKERLFQDVQREADCEFMCNSFSKCGSKSIFSRGRHNCFTWAIEKLKMLGIYLIDIPGELIMSLVKRVTQEDYLHQLSKVFVWV